MSVNRKFQSGIALSVAALMAVPILAGCGGGTAQSGSASGGSATVTWWGWTPDDVEAQAQIEAFNQEYPDITVQYKKIQDADYNAALRPALASKSGPDVFDVATGGATGDVATFGSSALDLTDAMVAANGESWKDTFYQSSLDAFTDDKGELKGAPIGRIASGFLWINQGLFDMYNLTPPTTLDEWRDVCNTLRENGVGCLTEGIGQPGFDIDTLHASADSVEPGVFTKATLGETPWTDPAIVQAFSIVKSLSDDGIMDDGAVGIQQYPDANNAFLSGKSAMVQMGTWYQQYTTEKALTAALSAAGVSDTADAITMIPIPFPDVAGKGNTPNLFGDPDYGVAVNARSANIDAATTFATWLSSSKVAQQQVADHLTDYPAIKGVETNWDDAALIDKDVQEPALQALADRVNKVDQARQANLPAEMIDALTTANQAVIGGQSTPEEAAASVQAAFDQLGTDK